MAEMMARRCHHVDVATTCAQSYVDWADAYEPGRSTIGGVVVYRFRVAAPRDNTRFNELNRRMVSGRGSPPLFWQRGRMREQGPWSPELRASLQPHSDRLEPGICLPYPYLSAS